MDVLQDSWEVDVSFDTQRLVRNWLDLDRNPVTRSEIVALANGGNENELKARLSTRMAFGTAGLRSKMGAGYTRMNDLTVIQTTQGLCCYLLEKFGVDACKNRGVVVGYDSRHNSHRFARLVVTVFVSKDFKVRLFSKYTPTPYTAYAVKKYGALAGVMVTASHNPKEYNGYKVYWDNGAQIIPPLDSGIAASIEGNLRPWATSWDDGVVDRHPNVVDPLHDIIRSYGEDLRPSCSKYEMNKTTSLRFTYTPMHGVGAEAVKDAFKVFGLPDYIPVAEQIDADPEFPTVKYPNPEEGEGALLLAMKEADRHGSCIILATDPDADRLAVAERDQSSGHWRIFTGNEVGTLLGWWAFTTYKERRPHFDGSKVHMLASTVSSKLLKSMAEVEGFQFQETLTGFKWMGNVSFQLLQKGHEVLFAFEEAIGYMFGTSVLDKDGVSAAAVMAECAVWLYANGKTFASQLEACYQRYGRFVSEVSYFICESKETIRELFHNLRAEKKYPTTCGGEKIISVVDLTVGYDSSRPPHFQPVLPVDSDSQMIQFVLDSCIFTLRTSGTEPKIKYYVEMATKPGSTTSEQEVKKRLKHIVKAIVDELLQPERYGLLAR
ncbi:hypothetical protein EMCRGX_G033959 [Ephydatia muelleri]